MKFLYASSKDNFKQALKGVCQVSLLPPNALFCFVPRAKPSSGVCYNQFDVALLFPAPCIRLKRLQSCCDLLIFRQLDSPHYLARCLA